jgi:hypothetical protein
MTERRFTDQDVAVILRRAVDLDQETGQDARGRGLTLEELQDIAVEVGVDPAMVTRAVAELGTRSPLGNLSLLGDPPVRRGVRAVPGTAEEDTLRELMRIVDREMPVQGAISEALGSVRWHSGTRFLSRQVSIEPSDAETIIRVEERFEDRVRAMMQLIPSFYGGMLGFVIGMEQLGGAAPGIALGLAGGVGVFAVAGRVWKWVSRRSRTRVEELADQLSAEASARLDATGGPHRRLAEGAEPAGSVAEGDPAQGPQAGTATGKSPSPDQ